PWLELLVVIFKSGTDELDRFGDNMVKKVIRARTYCGSHQSVQSFSALSGFVATFQIYDDFSAGMSFFQVPNGLRGFTQPVALVDYRFHLSSSHELAYGAQVFFVHFRDEREETLAHEAREHRRCNHMSEDESGRVLGRSSDDADTLRIQDAPQGGQRMVPHVIENQVVSLPALDEIFPDVIDDA